MDEQVKMPFIVKVAPECAAEFEKSLPATATVLAKRKYAYEVYEKWLLEDYGIEEAGEMELYPEYEGLWLRVTEKEYEFLGWKRVEKTPPPDWKPVKEMFTPIGDKENKIMALEPGMTIEKEEHWYVAGNMIFCNGRLVGIAKGITGADVVKRIENAYGWTDEMKSKL